MLGKIYFGHPINIYNTELESRLLVQISDYFPGWFIENPNKPEHQEGYGRWKEQYGNGMDYYYAVVLPTCSAGIFLPFRDGKWGAGVFGEAQFLHKINHPIFQITWNGEITIVGDLGNIPVLSIEETRKRIRKPSGKTMPY